MWVDYCRFVVCDLWFGEEFQNAVPELVCLGSWFQNLIIVKNQVFELLNPFGLAPTKVVPQNEIWQEAILKTLKVPAKVVYRYYSHQNGFLKNEKC
jgi:hypothetical protein